MSAPAHPGIQTAPVVQIVPHSKPSSGHAPTNQIWRDNLAWRGDRIIGDERNVMHALRTAPDLVELVHFNEFDGRVEFHYPPPWRKAHRREPWQDQDDLQLQTWLQEKGVEVRQRASIAECVAAVSRDFTDHPVRDYLHALRWDGEPRLQLWLAEYLNAQGPPNYLAAIGRKFLVSAVARIQLPGCQVDHVLTLEGPQGIGKTQCVKILGDPWTTDGLPDLHSKDAAIHLSGVWLVEIAELAAMRRSQIESTKAFLSRRDDRYRPPYARRAVDVPRQCCFVATTNEATYLRDPTGHRRFWPVKCGQTINLDGLARDRDQLWAEALHLYQHGEKWHPNEAESQLAAVEQEQRVLTTELEQRVTEYLDRQTEAGLDEVTTAQVFTNALNVDPAIDAERAVRLGRQLAEAMQRAGWTRIGITGRGKSRKTVYRCTEIHRDKVLPYATRVLERDRST
jgi:putative DNA primase/helicase